MKKQIPPELKPYQSALFHPDGRVEVMESKVAYALWLKTPHTVLRVWGDRSPVYRWEFSTP